MAQDRLDARLQRSCSEGFHQERVGAGLDGAHFAFCMVVGARDKYRKKTRAGRLFKDSAKLDGTQFRHLEPDNHQVGMFHRNLPKRFRRIAGIDQLVTL